MPTQKKAPGKKTPRKQVSGGAKNEAFGGGKNTWDNLAVSKNRRKGGGKIHLVKTQIKKKTRGNGAPGPKPKSLKLRKKIKPEWQKNTNGWGKQKEGNVYGGTDRPFRSDEQKQTSVTKA